MHRETILNKNKEIDLFFVFYHPNKSMELKHNDSKKQQSLLLLFICFSKIKTIMNSLIYYFS